jgi:tetratricopeptide (TPR) repeat protein
MSRLLLAIALLLSLGAPSLAKRPRRHPAKAGSSSAKEAATHYKAGMEAFNRQSYDEAAKELQAGFDILPDPTFQYNLGQVYRQAGKPEEAVAAYERFLEMAVNPPNQDEVEGYLKELRPLVKPVHKEGDATMNPFDTPAQAAPPPTAPTPAPAPAPDTQEGQTSSLKKGHYLFLGITVALVLAGTACGVAAQSYANDTVNDQTMTGRMPTAFDAAAQAQYHHNVALGQLSNALAITFFSLSAATAVASAVLYFLDSRREDARHVAIVPVVSSDRAGLAAAWTF